MCSTLRILCLISFTKHSGFGRTRVVYVLRLLLHRAIMGYHGDVSPRREVSRL